MSSLRKPFKIIFEGLSQAERESVKLEPVAAAVNIGRNDNVADKFDSWSG